MLDVLVGEFVQMSRVAANPRDFIKRQNRPPQPDWWDDEGNDEMVSRNAAWRCWCRERTTESREIIRSKRLEFHDLVRRKKAAFWHAWFEMQDRVSSANPRVAARSICRHFGPIRRPLPISMRFAMGQWKVLRALMLVGVAISGMFHHPSGLRPVTAKACMLTCLACVAQ